MTLISDMSEPVELARVEYVKVPPVGGFYRRRMKRLLDVILVVLSAPLSLTVILGCALVVMAQGGRPFYSQPRVGRNGRVYRMWKLRTMVPDAEAALERLLASDPDARAEWDLMQKLEHDPRITRIGRFLRRTSLDELPQLWNVLWGQMSLIGPRPMMPEQKALYPCTAYYRLRPGITGAWQVSDRNQTTFAERARYDRDYEARLSFGGDCRLLLATLGTVVKATGR